MNWHGYSSGDNDYSIWITNPGSDIGLCTTHTDQGQRENRQQIEMEFDTRETIDQWDQQSWWHAFHQAVDRKELNPGGIDKKDAIAIGLAGLDCGHRESGNGCKSELHPLYALAIHTNDRPALNDEWTFFVRNWGNEGGCSDLRQLWLWNTHGEPIKIYVAKAGATGATIRLDIAKSGSEWASGEFVPGGVMLSFHLVSGRFRGWVAGQVHIDWTFSRAGVPVAQISDGLAATLQMPIGRVIAP